MSNRKLENQKLDEIGKMLIKNSALRSDELEAIVADRRLFDGVRARIATPDKSSGVGLLTLFRRNVVVLGGAVMTIATLAFAITIFRAENPSFAVRHIPTANQTSSVPKFNRGDSAVVSLPAAERQIRPERTSAGSIPKVTREKRHDLGTESHDGEFYAISYAGDPNETERGSRIVRVDIPRSTLFAMGVDIPLENDAETVKADLLVGNDGVTRAIRVVR